MSRPARKRLVSVLVFCLLFFTAARFTGCSPALFWARRSHLTDLLSAMLPPEWGYAPRILAPLLATLQMSVTGTALGAVLHGGPPHPTAPPGAASAAHSGASLLPCPYSGPAGHIFVWAWHLFRHRGHHGLHLCYPDPADL